MKELHMIALLILVIGGLNLLALGTIGSELGSLFGGQDALISRIIYIVVGLAAIYEFIIHRAYYSQSSM